MSTTYRSATHSCAITWARGQRRVGSSANMRLSRSTAPASAAGSVCSKNASPALRSSVSAPPKTAPLSAQAGHLPLGEHHEEAPAQLEHGRPFRRPAAAGADLPPSPSSHSPCSREARSPASPGLCSRHERLKPGSCHARGAQYRTGVFSTIMAPNSQLDCCIF